MFMTLLCASFFVAGQDDYPRKELLIEPEKLAKTLGHFRILDARSKDKYLRGHIPSAIWIDHEHWSKTFAKHQQPADWAAMLGGAGVVPDLSVVIYDDASSKNAARIWWILRYWGCRDVRLLNGGWQGWVDRDLPVSKKVDTPARLTIAARKPNANLLATRESVLDILKEKKTQIIDTRSAAEHCGDKKLARRGGAIPGAIHLEWSDLLDKNTGRFKRPDELREIFKKAGIDLTKPAVAHCQSGGRSSVMVFVMELMGAREVGNYYRGWSEWGNDDQTPVAVPNKK